MSIDSSKFSTLVYEKFFASAPLSVKQMQPYSLLYGYIVRTERTYVWKVLRKDSGQHPFMLVIFTIIITFLVFI